MKHFTIAAQLKASPAACFDALTRHVSRWWSERVEGNANKEGEIFTVYFGTTRKSFKVDTLLAEQRVVWTCTDAYLDLDTLTNKAEWTGTDIIWDLAASENGTSLYLEHIGLTASIECYEVCEQGWQHFINDSLKRFVETGKGVPHSV